jgi:hypothetical protein
VNGTAAVKYAKDLRKKMNRLDDKLRPLQEKLTLTTSDEEHKLILAEVSVRE